MKKKKTKENIIVESMLAHKNENYDYSKVVYKNYNTKMCIICPEHGEFWQTPHKHISGQGCPLCSKNKKDNMISFINKAKIIHNNRYTYNDDYVNSKTKIRITCPIHGDFYQTPHSHLQGCGCNKCAIEKRKLSQSYTQEQFNTKARLKHIGKNYIYNDDYVDSKTKIRITCPIHGDFYQTPNMHLLGEGCPKCKSSHIEDEIRKLLFNNSIQFEEQKKFSWLGLQSLDFYLPDYNVGIECQGLQHFEPIDYFGGLKRLYETENKDKRKYKLCNKNGVKLLYYANYDYNFPYKVITDKNKLLENIR